MKGILKKKKPVSSLFVGNYKTKQKGKGMEFFDFGEYQYGDDAKGIDFVRSQQTGNSLVRRYDIEKELSVFFLLDWSETLLFGENKNKKDVLLESLALLSNLAVKNNDKIGALFLNNGEFFPAKKGIMHAEFLLNKISEKSLFSFSESEKYNLNSFLHQPIKNNLVFLFSDKMNAFEEKYLKILGLKHELIYVHILDKNEHKLKTTSGTIAFNDKRSFGIFGFFYKKKLGIFNAFMKRKIKTFQQFLIKREIGYIFLDTSSDIQKEFFTFFQGR